MTSLERRVKALESVQAKAARWPNHVVMVSVDENDPPEAVEAAQKAAQDKRRVERGLPDTEEIGVILLRIVHPKHEYGK